ncbi:hypothetical protein MKW94_016330 [Papaver nudicaule]|uniref:Uncharacterized protein n=1 Tax=Papaver nudicaule TaxID=74823 RepID=A0AA42APM4_PAPNU|nr:hypothetical protein [Papaver nudicaule]
MISLFFTQLCCCRIEKISLAVRDFRFKGMSTVRTLDHGTIVDKINHHVIIGCNYCGKKVHGYSRFKLHLGGIRGKVKACDEVPEDVKVQMRNSLQMKKEVRRCLRKEISSSDDSPGKNDNHVESSQPYMLRKRKHGTIKEFFIENGIAFSAANSSTFKKMIHALVGGGSKAYRVPSYDDLNGWILDGELKAMREHVREVVCFWRSTGCSILLDGWTDEIGRYMINFVVDSPRGPIFMKSDSIGDIDAMISSLRGVIEEVGVQNVAVGKQITEKYKSIFWTVRSSHCIGLMLEKIGMLGTERGVIGKAKTITRFIYRHEAALKLMRKHTHSVDLVSSSRIKSVVPFLILERIESQKKYLRKMFISQEWKNSLLASTANGRMVADLVTGDSFWTEAEMLLKASIPLIRALHLLSGGDSKPQLGYLYETIDQVKETIKEEYKGRETKYKPFWTVINGIWDNNLHSPIHAAGYYLNPGLIYFDNFYANDEVKTGLLCCIVRIVEDEREQDLITSQFDDYRMSRGAFGNGDAVDQRTMLSPAKWWSLYGGECPELQRFAIRILSQTCTGALRYSLKRSLTEQLHMKERNCVEQKRLAELIFIHHNLQLQNLPASNSDHADIFLEPIGPMDAWIGGGSMEVKAAEQNGNV